MTSIKHTGIFNIEFLHFLSSVSETRCGFIKTSCTWSRTAAAYKSFRTNSVLKNVNTRRTKSDSPTDIEVTVLFEQDISDVSAVKPQVVLDISGSCCYGSSFPLLLVISGKTHLEVVQGTARHKALQLLSGKRTKYAETNLNTSGRCESNFPDFS